MRTVSEQIGEWISAAGESWTLGDGAVTWARDVGADGTRAWLECPRADHLVLVAAIGGLDLVLLHREACKVVRGFPTLLPEHGPVFAALTHQAESWMRGEAVPEALPLAQRRVLRELSDAATRANDEEDAARGAIEASLVAIVGATRRHARELNDSGRISRILLLLAGSLRSGEHPIADLWRYHQARHRRAAAAYAMRAAVACVTLSKVAEHAATTRAILASTARSPGEDHLRQSTLLRLAGLERKHFALAGEVFHYASLAHAWRWGANQDAVTQGFLALAEESAAQSRGLTDAIEPSALVAAFQIAIVERTDERTAEALRAFADALRAATRVEALTFHGHSRIGHVEDAELRSGAARRRTTRHALEGVLADLVSLTAEEEVGALADVVSVAAALVSAPGPIHRVTLARVIATAHERFAGLLHAELREEETATVARRRAVLQRLERQARVCESWLGSEPHRLTN